jgi:hypothetical protein
MNGYPQVVPVVGASPDSQLPAYPATTEAFPVSTDSGNRDMWLYRERTVALLRRYLRISIEVGRLPSILGRELFRFKVTSYRMSSFEDGVIFVHDVEQALDQLQLFPRRIIAAVLFQEYTHEEAAEVLHCGRRTITREFPLALDQISEIFLEGGLLNRLPACTRSVEKSCQRGQEGQFPLSYCSTAE